MRIVNKFEEIEALPMPDDVKAKLLEHLIEPFGDTKSAGEIWKEISTCLYLIEDSDIDETLQEQSEQVQHLLRFVINYPEFVLLLDSDESPWLLALAIITSDGGGVYLTAPLSSPTFPVVKLADQAES